MMGLQQAGALCIRTVCLGLLLLAAVVSLCIAEEPDTLISDAEVLGEYCDGYYDENEEYHAGFQCTGTRETPDDLYCCGTETDKYCCDQGFFIDSLNLGNLIGILIGVFVIVCIGIILCCCCCSCCFCAGERLCSNRSHHHQHPVSRRGRSSRFISPEGIRNTLLRARRKRRSPNGEGSTTASDGQQLTSPTRHHHRPAPTQPPYPGQPYPPNQQYPSQQYPLQQYPSNQYPPPQYPSNYPPNYPTQPYPHPVPRMVNQNYPDPTIAMPNFSAPPPPYSATSTDYLQGDGAPPPLPDKHGASSTDSQREEYPDSPGACYPPPLPSPRYQPPPPSSPRFAPVPAPRSSRAPPLMDKQRAAATAAQEFPEVCPPPTSRRGPPSAPPEEDNSYPRKM